MNAEAPRPRGPVVVRGLTKFMEKQQSAARLRQQQAERERKVFLQDAASRPLSRSFTVPEPFRCAAPEREEERRRRQRALREKVMGEVLAECTFKPRTKEAVNREVLRRLMERAERLDGLEAGSGGAYEDAMEAAEGFFEEEMMGGAAGYAEGGGDDDGGYYDGY